MTLPAGRTGARGVPAALVALCCLLAPAAHAPATAQAATAAVQAPPAVLALQTPEPPEVTARGAVVWDPDDDAVLYGVEETVARPMASTTKIMTVLLALEAGASAGDTVTVSPQAAGVGGASLDLVAGQQLPLDSLVAGLLLRSGNDASVAVAEHVAGSEAAFVERMNARAAALGLRDTRFVNSSGLTDDPGHHASPLDLARLAHVAMADETFARHAAATEATVPGLAPMVTRNEFLWRYDGADGVKTGFTSLAGLCLVASATRDGRRLYAVVLGSDDSFGDAAALLDHGFGAFARVEPLPAGAEAGRYRWAGAEVAMVAVDALAATVPSTAAVRWRITPRPSVRRPVAAGDPLGTAELVVDGDVWRTSTLAAASDVAGAQPASPATQVGEALQDALRSFARLRPLEHDVVGAATD